MWVGMRNQDVRYWTCYIKPFVVAEGDGFELPVPLATERLSCRVDPLGGVLFGELGFGLTNYQDREGDGCQHSEAEQHPVEKAGPVS